MRRVGLVTCSRWPEIAPDDLSLAQALQRRGALVRAAPWDEPSVRWEDFDRVVLRSCWDYHVRASEFLDWLSLLEKARVPLWNPAPLVRSNAQKSYLRDLASAGIPVLPTEWLEPGRRVDLAALLARRDWEEAVVKPLVSASAHRTLRTSRGRAAADQAALDELVSSGGVLVQQFAPEISSFGEWSLVFLDGAYSHAVVKRPAPGDFRVQDDFGGTASRQTPPAALVRQAQDLLSRHEPWLYARVDAIDRDGRLILMELELIEPSLFLGWDSRAADRFAEGILREARRP
jgi:hypothetical protein